MYDADRPSVERWWARLAEHLRAQGVAEVPATLTWPSDLHAHWRHPGVLLSQTCGYPLVTRLREAVQVVGSVAYAAEGCDGILYTSQLVVRAGGGWQHLEDLRGCTAAYNSTDSHSGYNALRALVAPLARQGRFFGQALASGSHRASIEMVLAAQADVAAIDCVTLAALVERQPDLRTRLQVLASTAPAPGLPLVTSAATSPATVAALQQGLQSAFADPALAEVRRALGLKGFEVTGRRHYQVIADCEDAALALGCTAL